MHADEHTPVDADTALARLMQGNARFLRDESIHHRSKREVPVDLVRGQWPFATILGCSDARVPPEILFDAGFGDLFVIRVAGNVISAEIAGSLQYASIHLRTQLFMVLGHEGCGAVQAALATKFQGLRERSRIALLLEHVLPALDGIDAGLAPEVQLHDAVEANVRWSMAQIRETPEGRARLAEGKMKLVGAVYDLASGRVRLLDQPSAVADFRA